MYIGSSRSLIYAQPSIQAGDTVTASVVGTTETLFASNYVIPANSLIVGQLIEVVGYGCFTLNAVTPPTQNARVKLGSTVLVETSPQSLIIGGTNMRYDFNCKFMVRAIGASGSMQCTGNLTFSSGLSSALTIVVGPSGALSDTANPVTIDTTIAQTLGLSVQFSANTAGNSNTLKQLMVFSSAL